MDEETFWIQQIAAGLHAHLTPEERASSATVLETILSWTNGTRTETAAGLLANHGGGRIILRAALKYLSRPDGFYDHDHLSKKDRALINALPPTPGKQHILVAGHSHAARDVPLPEGNHYLNTGTWTPLMEFPHWGDDRAIQTWIDGLQTQPDSGFIKRTYAEITPDGAHLQAW